MAVFLEFVLRNTVSATAGKGFLRKIQDSAIRTRQPRPPLGLLARMVATCPDDLAGPRDRALLLLAA
jgi:hypothetical protein